ncbi:hypothetical protein EDM57_02765 [Brevibacillus gelatini]|uniref:Uncharacterized protein n=1 Tax=Brevibacillus gelatini TaxID=1655277 RepID=A0A3M8BA75_9BACL|nr:Imm3 family immunity protein [Brevibacillus gelatini]RNB60243.1 hypothetical protein EDM57_02765 [Brevibacillus gelatini]
MDLKWEYKELVESFIEDYYSYKQNNMSDRESLARTYNEYETLLNQGEMEKAVIEILYGEFLLKQSKVLITAKEKTKEELLSLDFTKLRTELTDDEVKELISRRDNIVLRLDEKPLDFCSEARWYYQEINENVKKFFESLSFENEYAGQVVNHVLKRFERDCRNTMSENITIKVTLAELLINKGINAQEELNNILSELKQFNMEDVGQQLSEEEKEDLARRIKSLLINI